MNTVPPSGNDCKVNLSQARRRFLKSAVGAGLALGATGTRTATVHAAQTRKTRVGLIGTDGHTGIVLGSIPKLAGVELTAFAKSLPSDDVAQLKRNQAFTAKTHCYDHYEEMLEKEELDVVSVCMPFYRNAQVSIAAARRGLHIISEKPIATTLRDLAALRTAVEQSKVRLTSMMNMRCFPPYRAARKAVLEGLIGEPILVTSQKSYKFGTVRPWFYKKAETYGGTIPWAGIHAVDYMHWTTGRKYVEVSAWQGNKAHPDYPGFQDHGGILFKLDNAGTALCNIDYLRPATAPTHGDDRLRIAGSDGVLEVLGAEERVVLMTTTGGPHELELPAAVDLFADFLAGIAGKSEHLISQEDAFRMTEVCLKARNAAETGKWVEL